MIVFDLLCDSGHRFEGWFGSVEEFDSQLGRGLLSCPACGGLGVRRVPSATRYNAGAAKQAVSDPEAAGEDANPAMSTAIAYSHLIDTILKTTEDVGRGFPEEARKIHYREVPVRAIRGQATQAEHDALVEEGVPVQRFPVPSPETWN